MKKKQIRDLEVKATELFFTYLVMSSNRDFLPFPIHIIDKEIDKKWGCNNFKVKELPDYLFGIWWHHEVHVETNYVYDGSTNDRTTVTEKVDYLIGEFFGDYEREVDKFKPWRCHFNVTLCVPVKQLQKLIANEISHFPLDDTRQSYGTLIDIIDKFRFINNEPELAFCQCWNGWNYNEQYVSRATAKREYQKYLKYKKDVQDETNCSLNDQFKYFKNLLDSYGFEQFKDYILVDQEYGEADIKCSPRFELYFKAREEWDLGEPNKYGFYGACTLSNLLASKKREENKLYNNYRKFQVSSRKKYKHVMWYDDIDFFAYIATPQRFAREKKKERVVDITLPGLCFDTESFDK